MQLSRYLVSNRVHILANEAGHVTEYKPVYHRNVNVYRGINNTLEFRLKNADQKPVAVDNYTIHFVAFDSERRQVLKYSSNNVSGDITKLAPTGLFSVNIRENDLLNINQQYLSYSIYLEDADRQHSITYTDEWFGAEGTIYVSAAAFPGPVNATTVEFLEQQMGPEGWWTTEAVDAEPSVNGNEALHTAAIYSNGYVGNVKIQATLENQILDAQLTWTDIAEVTLNNPTEPVPVNFNGIFTYVRFVANEDPTNKITKILVRN